MVSFFVDPFILACPSPERGEEDFDAFVHGIIMLQSLRNWSAARVFSSVQVPDQLFAAGRYPLGDDLNRSLAAFGKDQIQARDVIEVVNSLLQRLPTLEGHLAVDAILYEQLVVDPELNTNGRPFALQEAFKDLLASIALLDTLEKPETNENITLTRGIADCPRMIVIKAVIVQAEGKKRLVVPLVVRGSSYLSQHANDIHSCINVDRAWIESPRGPAQTHALNGYVWIEAIKRGLTESHILRWRFGKSFLETAEALGFIHEPAKVRILLRACAETILQQNLADTHVLRIGEGPEEAQRVRGADKAWRRDIDKEFHLHYWTVGKEIEFGAVVIHDDFTIPE